MGLDGQDRPPALPSGRGGRYPGSLTEPPTVLVVVLRKAGIRNELRVRVVLPLALKGHEFHGDALDVGGGNEPLVDVDIPAHNDACEPPLP